MSPPPAWPIGFQTILVRAVLYVLFIGAIAQGAYLEALYLPSVRFTELGFTEFTQTLVLATCCAMLIYIRQVLKVWPTVTLLLLAFVAASLVREQDHSLDNYVAENTWKVLVALIIFPSLFWVVKQRQRFIEEFAHYSNTFAFGLFTAGVLTTYIFSRLYGRQEFWLAVLEDNFTREFKDAAEEVIELLGYSLILIATLELLLLARRIYKAKQLST
ncbi:hypothetical protein QEN58_14445 [Halomonas alkaliantarctica]|uniref:Intracellular septation protein A n=1 Tax=Halomonas alkaliantarctica TaxID=232346 RepID=A0ABY8LJA1_9GAMM|nr:hypothetical protein [Halomonas alkaliantarctica]WGI24521.1 hypothetical protein QEN58_14445 [Halomonas alkaliantarctica]